MSPLGCSFFFLIFLVRFIGVVSIVSVCLVCDSSIVATCLSTPAARFAFCLFSFISFLLFVVVLSIEPKQNQGDGWSTAKEFKPSSNFIAGRPKTALLFWFFGDFRCGVPLLIVILVIYKYRNR